MRLTYVSDTRVRIFNTISTSTTVYFYGIM